MSKRNYAVIFSLILMLFCCGFAASNDGPPVNMEVSSIYGEIGKMGSHVPVSVKLYGQDTAAFHGTLAVQTLENASETGQEVYEYQYPVEIGLGETKDINVYIPLGQRSSEIHVLLRDRTGKEVLSKTLFFETSRDVGRLLIGVLSDKPGELRYLDGVSLEYGMVQSKILPLNERTFPDDARGLELLDILVINSYETDRLSDEQVNALKTWVKDGGTLLIGTGATAYSSLGPLADDLVELPIEGVFYETINLGAEFAEKAPGDSDVEMVCADIVIPGGVVVEESDGLSLLTVVERGAGQVGIYCYDLGELKEFTEKNPSYVNTMLTDVLDENKISNLYYYSAYGSDLEYWSAYSLVNTGSIDRLPNLVVYGIVIAVYIAVVGPGLYLFLKKRDMSRFYSTSVLATSIVTAGVIYLLGVGTRFTSQFFTVASVIELDGSALKETSYMNVRTPDSRPFSVVIPSGYTVTPLSRTSRYDEQAVTDFGKNEKTGVELLFHESGTVLSSRHTKAFEPRFFKMEKEEMDTSGSGIDGNIQWFDGTISGTLTNNLPYTLEDAAILFYGQMYLIGDMESGEVREFHEEPLLVWPVGMSYMVAGQITGSDKLEESDEREYLERAERDGIVSYYIGEAFGRSSSKSYLIGIAPSGSLASSDGFRGQDISELVLYSNGLQVTSGQEEMIYRSGLQNRPQINSGNGAMYGDGLTMYGMEPVTVEYFLGDDMEIEKLSFMPVSDIFMENPSYYYLKRFNGSAYFYNQTTKSYDGVNLAKVDFSLEELRPYLSPDGTLRVKYTIDESDSTGVSWLLPHLMVTGRER